VSAEPSVTDPQPAGTAASAIAPAIAPVIAPVIDYAAHTPVMAHYLNTQ
jgi:hypothetical protein